MHSQSMLLEVTSLAKRFPAVWAHEVPNLKMDHCVMALQFGFNRKAGSTLQTLKWAWLQRNRKT